MTASGLGLFPLDGLGQEVLRNALLDGIWVLPGCGQADEACDRRASTSFFRGPVAGLLPWRPAGIMNQPCLTVLAGTKV